jgi:hypothetical protein
MSETRGIDGIVKVGGDQLLNVTSFSLEETTETIDVTSMGDENRVVLPTFVGFSGSFDGYWDPNDPLLGHDAVTEPSIRAGQTITFEFYPGGSESGSSYYSGSAIVASVSRSSSYDGAVEYSVSFEGTGNLAYSVA